MGVVTIRARIGNDAEHLYELDFIVGTGAFYRSLLQSSASERALRLRFENR